VTIRAAFYYPWFPEQWGSDPAAPFTNYHPTRGHYSTTLDVVKAHIAEMLYGHISAGIASWWGRGSKTDGRIPTLLQAAAGTAFKWCLYYEAEAGADPDPAQIKTDLDYIWTRYAQSPSYLRVNGRPVLFVYSSAGPNDAAPMVARWAQANADHRFYISLRVYPGYQNTQPQPDSWHQYDPSRYLDYQANFATAISPGFWKKGDAPLLARADEPTWRWLVSMMVNGTPWQLITTFNEWGEGTSVESASEWATASGHGMYLDALHAVPVQL
jgi:hypothetical protein